MYISKAFFRTGILAGSMLAVVSPVFAHEGRGAHVHAFLSDAGESPVSGLIAIALLTGLVLLVDAVVGKLKVRLAKSRRREKNN